MDWLRNAAFAVGLWVVAEIAGELLRPVLRPIGRLYTRAYAPPHGGLCLAATYAAAFIAVWATRWTGADRPGLSLVLVLGAAWFTMIGTLVFRDHRRATVAGTPTESATPSRVGTVTRSALAVLSASSFGVVSLLIRSDDAAVVTVVAAFAVVTIAAGIVAITGRVPWILRLSVGSSPEHDP